MNDIFAKNVVPKSKKTDKTMISLLIGLSMLY